MENTANDFVKEKEKLTDFTDFTHTSYFTACSARQLLMYTCRVNWVNWVILSNNVSSRLLCSHHLNSTKCVQNARIVFQLFVQSCERFFCSCHNFVYSDDGKRIIWVVAW